MSGSKHRARPQPKLSPAEEALIHTHGDLVNLAELWPRALEQLDLRTDTPPRLHEQPTPEQVEARDARIKAEKLDRFRDAQAGRVPLAGASPAPLRVEALETIAIAETGLLELGDRITAHIRRNKRERTLGPHRLRNEQLPRTAPPTRRDRDHLDYPLSLGYGYRVYSGRLVDVAGERHDSHPALAAIRWIRAALPAITDVTFAELVAGKVSRIRSQVRAVVGEPDLQIRISPACFVCGQPSLRLNIDSGYVECRNADCTPTPEQCTSLGPRGEPRWYRAEWDWLKQRLVDELGYPLSLGYGCSFDDEVRAVLEIAS